MKNKKLIASIILVVLLNSLVLWGWFYAHSLLKGQDEIIKQQRQKLALNEKSFQNSSSLKVLLEEIKGEKQVIDDIFINRENVINFIESLESLAKQTDVLIKIGSVNIENAKNGSLNLQINLRGDFRQTFHYLVLLENLPYLIDVERVNFRKVEEGWQADFEISLKGFKET